MVGQFLFPPFYYIKVLKAFTVIRLDQEPFPATHNNQAAITARDSAQSPCPSQKSFLSPQILFIYKAPSIIQSKFLTHFLYKTFQNLDGQSHCEYKLVKFDNDVPDNCYLTFHEVFYRIVAAA